MKETELKSIIDRDTYKQIKRDFNWTQVRVQDNYYYTDRDGILQNERIMVRVRVVGGKHRLQVKLHKNSDSPLQICEETEYEIDGIPETIEDTKAKEITGIDTGELFLMGKCTTKRRKFIKGTSQLCLDKTTYFENVTDYEVELEYVDKISAELLMKLARYGVQFNEKSVGKFSRFLAEYKKREDPEAVK